MQLKVTIIYFVVSNASTYLHRNTSISLFDYISQYWQKKLLTFVKHSPAYTLYLVQSKHITTLSTSVIIFYTCPNFPFTVHCAKKPCYYLVKAIITQAPFNCPLLVCLCWLTFQSLQHQLPAKSQTYTHTHIRIA